MPSATEHPEFLMPGQVSRPKAFVD